MGKSAKYWNHKRKGFIDGKFGNTYNPPNGVINKEAYKEGFKRGQAWLKGYEDAVDDYRFELKPIDNKDSYMIGYQAGAEKERGLR